MKLRINDPSSTNFTTEKLQFIQTLIQQYSVTIQGSEMIIFVSISTTFGSSIVFEADGSVVKIGSSLKPRLRMKMNSLS